MSEYQSVEKPLLTQLASMGWKVIEQALGIPKNPDISLRSDFREVLIKSEFKQAVQAINLVDRQAWLTDEQLAGLYNDFTDFGGRSLLKNKQEFIQCLTKW